jgi:DNA-binding transcriptional LysR family regulator
VDTTLPARQRRASRGDDAAGVRHATPHELRAFLVVAETLHFSRASARLGVAQSTLSELVRRLEDKLGAVVLDRTPRRVRLTPAGTRLVPAARAALAALGRLQAVVDEPPDAQATLRVGVEAGGLAELNGPVLAAIAERLPFRRLAVRESLGAARAFAEQELDLAIARSPVARNLVANVVAQEERGLLVPPGHPLEYRGGGLADVLREPFVAVAPHHPPTRDYWLGTESRGGRDPVLGGAAHTLREVVDAVGHLGLLTTGCRSMLRATPMPEARLVSEPALAPNAIALVLRRDERRPEVRALVGVVRDVVAGMAGEAPGITAVR